MMIIRLSSRGDRMETAATPEQRSPRHSSSKGGEGPLSLSWEGEGGKMASSPHSKRGGRSYSLTRQLKEGEKARVLLFYF